MNLRGIASGALALVALEVIVTSPQTGRLAQLFALPASWARILIDPNVPAIADHSGGTNITPSATAKTSAATTPPGAFNPSAVTV